MSRQHYYLSVEDLTRARGEDDDFSFKGRSPDGLATSIQQALRERTLFERWRERQPDPDDVDAALAAVDPEATASAEQVDLHCDVQVTTGLPMQVLRHRLRLLIGSHWTLRDVRTA